MLRAELFAAKVEGFIFMEGTGPVLLGSEAPSSIRDDRIRASVLMELAAI